MSAWRAFLREVFSAPPWPLLLRWAARWYLAMWSLLGWPKLSQEELDEWKRWAK